MFNKNTKNLPISPLTNILHNFSIQKAHRFLTNKNTARFKIYFSYLG